MPIVENVSQRLQSIQLERSEYLQTLEQAAASGIVGRAICDALVVPCAQKANATVIYT
jgi:flagellar biosynthesis chaperone FliJ